MKTWLCTTLVNFLSPMQGAARLYAYLKKEGHNVSFQDSNQDIYFTLLSPEYLGDAFEKAKSMLFPITRNQFTRENIGSILLGNSRNAIRQLAAQGIVSNSHGLGTLKSIKFLGNILSKLAETRIDSSNVIYALLSCRDHIIGEVDKSRRILYEKWFTLSPDEFLLHFQTLLCGKAVIDAVYYPAQLDFGLGFAGTAYRPHAQDIVRAVKDERYNFLIPYYSNKIIPLLNKEQPGIVGISITHTSEFVPAFTLAAMIKRRYPEIHIVLGGATATEIAYRIAKNLSLWDFFDSLILGPGEYAFSELIKACEAKKPLSEVPNLIYKEKDTVKKSEKSFEFNLNHACTPEYVSLRPKSGVPLETSSGCYWGKCIFCYYPKEGLADVSDSRNFRVRDIKLVLEDIRRLQESYDPLYIGITDSALSSKRMEAIVEQNMQSDKKVKFSAFIRFEKKFTSKKFCNKLREGGFLGGQVGLESGSQRVNNIINKGISLEDAKIILKNFYKTKILVHLYTIVGIPGETKKESFLTLNFIKRHHRLLTLDWQIYPLRVLEHSPIAERAKEFGLSLEALPDEFLTQIMKYELKEGLSQKDSTSLSIRFYEALKRYMNPLRNFMDIETYKLFIFAQAAKGFFLDKNKKLLKK